MMFRRLFLWLGLLLFVSACVAPTSTPKAIPAFVPTTINISTVAPTPTIAYAENYADAISITEFGQDNSPHLSWLPDNKTLIVWSEESTGSKSGEIRFMDSTNWQEVRSIKYKESIYYVGVDTEGRYLLINDSILDFNSEQYLYSLVPGGIPRGFSKNGEFIIGVGACGTLCGELRIWDAHTGKQQSELSNFADGYPTFALSPDDQIVAFGDWQTRVTYWDVASGERLGSPIDAPPSGYVSSLTYSL